jgi:GxxExxY protein
MEFEALTEKIIGCAFKVYNTMSFGFVERVYENCLMIELGNAGLGAAAQVPISVSYAGRSVGEFVADIVVEDTVVLELKSVRAIVEAHEVQLVNYLTATGKTVGLLLNFSPTELQIKRKVKSLEHVADRINRTDGATGGGTKR